MHGFVQDECSSMAKVNGASCSDPSVSSLCSCVGLPNHLDFIFYFVLFCFLYPTHTWQDVLLSHQVSPGCPELWKLQPVRSNPGLSQASVLVVLWQEVPREFWTPLCDITLPW